MRTVLPLNNTTDYSFFGNKDKAFTPNYPYELINENFTPNQALIAGIDLQFKPGQRYIEFPDNRLALGSKYPTLALSLSHRHSQFAGIRRELCKMAVFFLGQYQF